jgi:hypothetical protein
MRQQQGLMLRVVALCSVAVAASAGGVALAESPALPIKGGERILFIGNSLTGSLPEELNELFAGNGLPAFEGYRLQIWNQTFETHWTLSRETHAGLFHDPIPGHADGYAVKGQCTLWKKGQYNDPKYVDRGYILAAEAIRNGTPDGKPWDIVVLQSYRSHLEENKMTTGPDGKPTFEGPFMKYGALLLDEIKNIGAQPLFYQPWVLNPEQGGGPDDPKSYYNTNFDRNIANHKILSEAYGGVPVIPVGSAMRILSKERRPEGAPVGWLIVDNVHPTAFGKALMLYTIGSALSGKPATALSWNPAKGQYAVGKPVITDRASKQTWVLTADTDRLIKEVAAEQLTAAGF